METSNENEAFFKCLNNMKNLTPRMKKLLLNALNSEDLTPDVKILEEQANDLGKYLFYIKAFICS
jgi:hypothetical protein